MSIRSLLTGGAPDACPICNDTGCTGFEDIPTPEKYPFVRGGFDPMEGQEYVLAPYAIEDTELGRNVYGAGDKVPMADAIKYGLVPAPRKTARKKTQGANRARKPAGDR